MIVTCLCITTRSRRAWIANALACFDNQTHLGRELLFVVDDDKDAFLLKLALSRKDVHVQVNANPQTIGEKRNIGCQISSGDVICHWDDDDYSSPDRLRDQVVRLRESGKAVTAYNKMKFTDGQNWWLYDGILSSVGIGTSLCYTKEYWNNHRFQPLQVAEDNAFISEARRCGQFVNAPACGPEPRAGIETEDLMYATIHAGNTSPRDTRPWIKL